VFTSIQIVHLQSNFLIIVSCTHEKNTSNRRELEVKLVVTYKTYLFLDECKDTIHLPA